MSNEMYIIILYILLLIIVGIWYVYKNELI